MLLLQDDYDFFLSVCVQLPNHNTSLFEVCSPHYLLQFFLVLEGGLRRGRAGLRALGRRLRSTGMMLVLKAAASRMHPLLAQRANDF